MNFHFTHVTIGMRKFSRRPNMAARGKYEPPPIEIRKFTRSEIDWGITKLRRRLDEVRGLDPKEIPFDDARVEVVASNIRETIREVFGSRSPEFNDHQYHR